MNAEGAETPPPEVPAEENFLFTEAGLRSPLEELRSIYEKRLRTARNLGEEEEARLCEAAYSLARKKLAACLGEEP